MYLETKIKIMKQAFDLFAKKGISFSLNEIANEVGIKKASIYAHFENKEELISNVINDEIEKYFFEINQENDDLKKIFFGVLHYYNDSQNKLLFWKRLLLLPPESLAPELQMKINSMSEKRYEIVKNLILRDMKLGTLKTVSEEEVTLMFFSLIHGLLSSVLIYHPQDIKIHYNNIWNSFWNSIIE